MPLPRLGCPRNPLRYHGRPAHQHPWHLTTNSMAGCRRAVAAASTGQDATETLSHLTRLARQLDIAIAEEDYALAARLRDESKALFDPLPAVQQYIYHQLRALRSASSLEERLKAVEGLGSTGDVTALPHLAALLPDDSLQAIAQAAMWSIFMTCKEDPLAQEALLEGTRLMSNDLTQDHARQLFEQVVKRCPNFAEGHNKLATLDYMQRRFRESIKGCQTVLELQPYHFGAASGMGLCYMQLGEYEEAVKAFERALSINPNLPDLPRIAASLRLSLARQERPKGQGS